MYPTEVYVALRGVEGVQDGVHDYLLLDHSIGAVWLGDPLPQLQKALFGDPALDDCQAAVILTGVWHRSSWRYRERGYRRVLLDTGHVLGNLVEVAPEEGFEARPVATFQDAPCEELVDADPVHEGVLAVVPLVDAGAAADVPRMPLRTSASVEWHQALDAVGDRLSPRVPERLIAAVHLAARIGPGAPVASVAATPRPAMEGRLRVDAATGPTLWDAAAPITHTIAERRSTRAFRAEPVAREALFRALDHALPDGTPDLFAAGFLRTYVVAMNVVGLPPGCYLYESESRALVEMDRNQHARAMYHLALGQQIFVDAAAAVVHTADLTRAVGCFGDRAYSLLGLDAGHIGQRLNLALLREGAGVSGCGGYFDDEMNRVLRIPESQAVIYITAVGTPL
jgi:SagB-type dehydrogenase family enzyme